MIRRVDVMLGALILLIGVPMAAYWLTPSSRFIVPINQSYEQDEGQWFGYFTRALPHGDVIGDWAIEIVVHSDGLECHASGQDLPFTLPLDNATHTSVSKYPAPAKLLPCLEAEGLKSHHQSVWVKVGPVRLRPVTTNFVVGYRQPQHPTTYTGDGG